MTLEERAQSLAAAMNLDIYTDADWLAAYQDLRWGVQLGEGPELSRAWEGLQHLTPEELLEHIDTDAAVILKEFEIVDKEARCGTRG